ncbi:hypothetical protein Syun_022849 [Stephania yunnanensis]|uniref:SLH domain-containing protein n=1 Tax=Stephania yunnanensis TaxID=152371 RepID=A0AAP0FKH2_9MAGN
MNSSISPSSCFFFIPRRPFDSHRRVSSHSIVSSPDRILNFTLSIRHRTLGFPASVFGTMVELSWLYPDRNAVEDYGGWSALESLIDENNKGLKSFFVVVVGATAAILLAAAAHRVYFSRKGFTFQFKNPLNIQGVPISQSTDGQSKVAISSDLKPDSVVSEKFQSIAPDDTHETNVSAEKLERLIIPVNADSTQQEALRILKELKIIEDDAKADELCTRREYARWLVKAYSTLERSAQHRIMPSLLQYHLVIQAFDDVTINDPDFWSIQSLAESGLVLSKLSDKNFFDADGQEGKGSIKFSAESFISRLDLISWKAQLEYSWIPGIDQEISRKKLDFIDMRTINHRASPELFVDMMAGDKSILRKVFGQIKRFQPDKPATKAQAAVALTSGRMTAAIHSELFRLEAEKSSRLSEMEEIRYELLLRGDILRFWNDKRQELKAFEEEIAMRFQTAIHDLNEEKNTREKSLVDYAKEKTTLDCQRQLLSSLKEEVNQMSERIAFESSSLVIEQQNLEYMSSELQVKQDTMIEAKSTLESEKEALHIVRSWVEDEARRNQACAKVLEEVWRRWKWDDVA